METYKPYDATVLAANIFDYMQKDLYEKNQKGVDVTQDSMAKPVTYKNLTQMMILLQAKYMEEKGTILFKNDIVCKNKDNWDLAVDSPGLDQSYGHFGSGNLMTIPVYMTGRMDKEDKQWLQENVKDIVQNNMHTNELLGRKMEETLAFKFSSPEKVKVELSDLEKMGKQYKEMENNGQLETYAGVQKVWDKTPIHSEKERDASTLAPTQERTAQKADNVNHPSHYANQGSIECIDFIGSVVNKYPGIIAGDLQNVTKYTWRSHGKNGKEDIEKAEWYFNHASKTYDSLDKGSKEMFQSVGAALEQSMIPKDKKIADIEDIRKQGIQEVTKNMPAEEKKLYQKIIHGVTHFYDEKARTEAKEALKEWIHSYDKFKPKDKTEKVVVNIAKPKASDKSMER